MQDRQQLVNFFYLDVNNTIDKENFGYLQRLDAARDEKEVSCIIPLNRYSFFKSLETNKLPPSQIQISATLTDDNVLIYKTNDAENA